MPAVSYCLLAWKGFMKYVVEMGSVVMIYIQIFIKFGPGI
jgi:hypothetical protein